jgi:hypothetical protein
MLTILPLTSPLFFGGRGNGRLFPGDRSVVVMLADVEQPIDRAPVLVLYLIEENAIAGVDTKRPYALQAALLLDAKSMTRRAFSFVRLTKCSMALSTASCNFEVRVL